MLKLTRPLLCFDVESSGTDPANNRIITLHATLMNPDGSGQTGSWMVKPPFHIPAAVTAIHGITDEIVKDKPPFKNVAKDIFRMFLNCDLLGFNLLNFDIPILWEEFYRCGITWDLKSINIIDAGNIFKKKEERTLAAALKFYCKQVHESAHDAAADVQATIDVLQGQLIRYDDLAAMDMAALAEFSKFDNRVDLAGKIVLNEQGEPVYNFGKSKGVRVVDDQGFGFWILGKDFSENTKQAIRRIFDEDAAKVAATRGKEEDELF